MTDGIIQQVFNKEILQLESELRIAEDTDGIEYDAIEHHIHLLCKLQQELIEKIKQESFVVGKFSHLPLVYRHRLIGDNKDGM